MTALDSSLNITLRQKGVHHLGQPQKKDHTFKSSDSIKETCSGTWFKHIEFSGEATGQLVSEKGLKTE